MSDLLEVEDGCDPRSVMEDVRRAEVVVDELLVLAGTLAADLIGTGCERLVHRRQHLARLDDLGFVIDVEEIAFDDREDAEEEPTSR